MVSDLCIHVFTSFVRFGILAENPRVCRLFMILILVFICLMLWLFVLNLVVVMLVVIGVIF